VIGARFRAGWIEATLEDRHPRIIGR
jgi:hypothetical protein